MATTSDKSVKYKAISGQLSEHFGFKLSADGTVLNAENVWCLHCHKSFAFHGSNTSLRYHLQHGSNINITFDGSKKGFFGLYF